MEHGAIVALNRVLGRSEEIDLSHEFPPEPREAQVDPQAGAYIGLGVRETHLGSIGMAGATRDISVLGFWPALLVG